MARWSEDATDGAFRAALTLLSGWEVDRPTAALLLGLTLRELIDWRDEGQVVGRDAVLGRLRGVVEFAAELREAFGTRREIVEWLHARQRSLRGRTPIEAMLRDGPGDVRRCLAVDTGCILVPA